MTRTGKPRVRRGLWWALGIVVFIVCAGIGAVQIFGNDMGQPCKDSYSCKGFLIGGAECVVIDGKSLCTRYCDDDSDCPGGWQCRGATPTVVTVKTAATDEVCMPKESTGRR